jgi:cytoskeletal protein CcmA (bactofilin family)
MIQQPDPQIALDDDEDLQNREPEEGVETVVGPSVHVQGEFKSKGDIIVKGIVSGDVKTNQLLTVESGAEIDADVRANSATISGEVEGSVTVSDKLDITETAKIQGDIRCETLVVAPGAVIQGNIQMEGSAGRSQSQDSQGFTEEYEEEYDEEEEFEEE